MQQKLLTGHNRGFSLLEILVALVLIGLLVGALVPTVLSQLGKGEVNRVVEDLQSVETAAKTFRVDVSRWPADLEDLSNAISSTDSDINGDDYRQGHLGRWAGPYLEGVVIAVEGDTLGTAAGAFIQDAFEIETLNSQDYLTITVTGLTEAMIADVSEVIDGNEVVAFDDTGGQIRASSTILYYLATPIK
jgi:general secretion pathway protein G